MSTGTTGAELTERERQILDFESGPHWIYLGAKEQEIRRLFGVSGTRYFQGFARRTSTSGIARSRESSHRWGVIPRPALGLVGRSRPSTRCSTGQRRWSTRRR